jgi:hypothetical protein
MCEIEHYTWLIPRPADYQMGGGATGSSSFRAVRRSPVNGTQISAARRANRRSITAQTQSAGSITCDSELSGVTCTDASTGHFFRVSRDSYQVG